MPETPRQTFRVSEPLWRRFQKKCALKGYSASDVLRAFIIMIIEGKISVDSVKPSRAKRGEILATDDIILAWLKLDSHRTSNDTH